MIYAIIFAAALGLIILGVIIWDHYPTISKPYRITMKGQHGRTELRIIRRFGSDEYGEDVLFRSNIDMSDTDSDDKLAKALSDAQSKLAQLNSTQREIYRLNK